MKRAVSSWLVVVWVFGLSQASPFTHTGGVSQASYQPYLTLESSSANVRVAAPHSPGQPLHLQVEAFNQRHHLALTPAPSPFTQTFRFQRTARDNQGRLLLQDVEDVNFDLNTVYQDQQTGAVISVDGSKVEGLLTPTLSIKHSDGSHNAFLQHHVDPEYPVDSATRSSDYLEIPQELRNKQRVTSTPRAAVSATPELYVIVDSTMAESLGSDSNIIQYLSIFWNAVNHRFATMSDPKINLVLAGALIVRKSVDEPYIKDNILPQNNSYIHGENTLSSISEWLYQRDNLPSYDIAYLMTGKDMAYTSNGFIKAGLAGFAWLGAACEVASGNKRSLNTAIGEDIGTYYTGVMTAAHELAHNLGAPHDGKNGAEDCSWDLGYIMSYVTENRNTFFFSQCSQTLMTNYISSDYGDCLKSTSPGSTISLSSKLPGDGLSLDEQCQKATGETDAYASKSETDNSLCVELKCQWQVRRAPNIWIYTKHTGKPAAEGSSCKNGGVCTDGICK